MKFIGRTEEIKVINSLLDSPGYQSCVIYGRRRLGKTELIKKCVLNRDVTKIIYQCKESSEIENALLLTSLISDTLDQPFIHFSSFIEALEYLFKYSLERDIIVVIDEYPYVRELIQGCDSKLQNLIDNYQSECNMKLFLLGSSIEIMEDIFSRNSPLFGRFTQSILLKQMDYYDSSLFYESFSNEEKVKLYSVFGGVPFYNAQINPKLSVKENIIKLVSGEYANFKDFIETYLKSELRKVNNANRVFEIIACGAFHFSDILSKSYLETSSALSQILQKLIKMDLIEYVAPINEKDNKQKAGYRISDNCLRFYYKYIYKNESAHAIIDDDIFFDNFIKDDFNSSFVPNVFESIAKQYLIRLNKRGKINPLLYDIGTYWYDNPKEKKNGQFDVVAKTKTGYIFFECKYVNSKVNDQVIENEIKQIKETTLCPIQYGFISKSGFDLKQKYPYIFIDLNDLYSKLS